MRILLCAAGSYGDVYPFVGLGKALRARGHDAVVLTNEYFRPAVEAEGLTLAPVGDEAFYRSVIDNPDLWHPKRGLTLALESTTKLLDESYACLSGWHKPGETVVVASTIAFAARVFQEVEGVPQASVHLAPSVLRSRHDAIRLPFATIPAWVPGAAKEAFFRMVDRKAIDPALGPALNAFRARFGLPPAERLFQDWLHAPDRVIGLFPEAFAPRRADWPPQTRLTGFPLYDAAAHEAVPEAVERFLRDGEPPVLFAPGSASTVAGDFFRDSLEACRRAGLRALLVTRYPEQVPEALPETALHADYVPFSEVLPRVQAFVHHGGIGTLSQGLAAGVPQIIRPVGFDQQDNAARARALGVAEVIPVRAYRPRRVAAALRRLGAQERLVHCRSLAPRFADPGALDRAAGLVEALIEPRGVETGGAESRRTG